jgi:hypothetical protein
VQRSFGVWGLLIEPVSFDSFEQRVVVRRIPNPESVYWDPDCKMADFSDMDFAYVLDSVKRSRFRSKWPQAHITDFTTEHLDMAPRWIQPDRVQIAEYWKRSELNREVFMVTDPMTGQPVSRFADELPDTVQLRKDRIWTPQGEIPILKDENGSLMRRKTKEPRVTQYITNGVEILDTTPWDGSWIPLFPVIGKELWVDLGDGPKRIWLSLIRLARDPQMLVNYYRTAEQETVGMTPKTKWVMYEGQIEGHEDEWESANRSPITALQVKATLDATGNNVLPLPQRQDYEPPIQALELGAVSAQRAIQSAMGMYNASVGDHDSRVKSGVAIGKLDAQSDVGTFHFRASFERAKAHEGRCMEELIRKHYNTPREVGARNREGIYRVARINQTYYDENGKEITLNIGDKRHVVTIGVGPSYQSERQRAEDFVDLVVKQVPQLFAQIGDLVFRYKHLGPMGDEIADRLTPPQFRKGPNGEAPLPPGVIEQKQQADQMIQMLTDTVNKLTEEIKSREIEWAARKDMQTSGDTVKLAIAELQTKAKMQADELGAWMTRIEQTIEGLNQHSARAHELGMAAAQQSHEAQQSQLDREHQVQQASSQVTHNFNPATGAIEPVDAASQS